MQEGRRTNMRLFLNLKITSKLILGFLPLVIIGMLVSIVGLAGMYRLGDADKRMYNENTLALQYTGSASTTFVLIRYNTYKLSVLTDPVALQPVVDNNKTLITSLEQFIKEAGKAIVKPEFKSVMDNISKEWTNDYKPGMDKVTSLVLSGDFASAKTLIPGLATLGTNMYNELISFLDILAKDSKSLSVSNIEITRQGTIEIVVAMVVGIVVSVLVVWYIARIIGGPIRQYSKAVATLSGGDIEIDIDYCDIDNDTLCRRDEIGELGNALHRLVVATQTQVGSLEKISSGDLTTDISVRSQKDSLGNALTSLVDGLNELVSTIETISEQVADGSNLVSNSSTMLSQGATSQASAVEELTSTLSDLSTRTQLNAKNAENANTLTTTVKAYAETGNAQMQRLMKSMDAISASSNDIKKIIKVIDDIAFQTNILALNAAVEAARAGEHGRGFAVVAEEVRNLAAKSANATKETTALIEGSIRNVQEGVKISTETSESLQRIVTSAESAVALVNSIAAASKEQATGFAQISLGISQVSEVVQTNVATAEESAAASVELSGQAASLVENVKQFRLKNNLGKAANTRIGKY